MCGIVGARHDWLLARGREPAAAMRDAVAALAWRGPDGQAAVPAGPWWLGCARLAITQPRSQQPVVRRGGRFVGVLNGAITDARDGWARLLPGAERRAAPPNDAWLPLLAVARGDLAWLATMRGHHAYAVVDTTTGALVLGRDAFGEKPLFALFERERGERHLVAFASTRPALASFGIATELPTRRLAEWFRFGFAPQRDERTRQHVLTKVPAGLGPCEPLARGRQRWRALTSTPTTSANPPSRNAADDLRTALLASVQRCTDTTVPAALALSGGLDSSCLALALGAIARRVPAYQLRAHDSDPAERTAAAAVAARAGLPLRLVDIGPEVLDALPTLTAHAGAPLGDPSILAVHALARAAARDGVRVLLGGEGADELLLGYRRYRALAHLPRARWLRPFVPRWSMRYAARLLRASAAADPVVALLAVTPPAFGETVLAEPLTRRSCWHDGNARQPRTGDLLAQARAHDLQNYLACDLLPKVDIATLAAGVEGRCPFLEARLPQRSVDRAALGKTVLRAAFAAELPPAVLALPKTGFALPLDRWFRGELPWLDLLAEPRTRQRAHLRPGGVAAAVDRHRAGRADLGHGLYLLVAAELFLRAREGLTGENPAPVPSGRRTRA